MRPRYFLKKHKEKKQREHTEHWAEALLKNDRQQFKPVGKIDLDSLNKKPEPVPGEQKPAEKPKEAPVAVEAEKEPAKDEKEAQSEKNVFKLKSENKQAPQVNVLGKIDLDSLNQSTRPKKKSKEEKRKEREEKVQQMRGAFPSAGRIGRPCADPGTAVAGQGGL